MNNITEDFLLQLSLITFPIGIYLAYVLGHLDKRKYMTLFLAVLWGISIALCISFPVSYGNGIHIDLRIVPLLIATLYGGRRTGLFLGAFVVLFRFYISGWSSSFYSTSAAILCGFSAILYFQKRFEQASKGKRLKLAILLTGYYSLAGACFVGITQGITAETMTVQLIHLGLAIGIVWMMVSLIENMAEIHTVRQELHKAERLRLVEDFAGVFAHEIRNPMQVVRGFLQLLDTPDLPPASKKQYIKLSIDELDRANEIIHEFLQLGKPSPDRNEEVDVGNQLKRSVHLIENYALSKNVSIETKIEQDCLISGNAQRLNQYMINIMKNAIESMPDGGTVFASCRAVDPSHIEIHVKDEGVGMSKQEVERLGSPYYSLKKDGTGLGMLISFQIIRSFGGQLHVFSEKNKGTEVIARIPSM